MIFMQSTIEVRPEEAEAFHGIMKEIVAFQEKEQGWRLACAFVQFTGALNTYVDIWQMSDAGHYQQGLFALRQHPDIARIRSVLSKAVVRETIVLGAPSPFFSNMSR